LFVGAVFLLTISQRPALARTPSESKVSRDVTRYWKKQWPDQKVVHVSRQSDKCEAASLEKKTRSGKIKTVKTCLILADVFIAQGDYRYHIYRANRLHYKGKRLLSIELGEMEKAWKEGGVPAPSSEQATTLLQAAAEKMLGADAKVSVVEMGVPRPYGDTYRITLVVDVAYTKESKPISKKKVLATLESTGGAWQAAEQLVF
jgi:hypothetical protein